MNSVPRLDLAPKLRRPLSLWNPLDYLRLLYWVFYFPQALRWYVDTFGGGFIPRRKMNLEKGWDLLKTNITLRKLLIQSQILSFIQLVFFIYFSLIESKVDFYSFNWQDSIGFFLIINITGFLFSLIWGTPYGLGWSVPLSSLFSYVLLTILIGRQLIFLRVLLNNIPFLINILSFAWMFPIICFFGAALNNIFWSIEAGVILDLTPKIAFSRFDDWLLGLVLARRQRNQEYIHFNHASAQPIIPIILQLRKWLILDWENGLHNANQLLCYTLQFISVIDSTNSVLEEFPPEQIIYRVAQLAASPFDWYIVCFASASLDLFPLNLFKGSVHEPKLRLNTPARSAAAGFWYLHKKEPAKAEEAFAIVRSFLYGEEMHTLAQVLRICKDFQLLSDELILQFPTFPVKSLLRPTTWRVLNIFRRVIEDTEVIQYSASRAARAFALNRAIGEVTQIIDNADTLPEAERGLIVDIAQNWKTALERQAREVGQIEITKPVKNPYTVGDPVEEEFFVGRQDIMRQLEELWLMGTQMQSVVLYGHRRMGKTSILRNLSQRLGAGVKVAYVNLLGVGDIAQAEGEFLMAMSDAISQAVNVEAPNDDDLLNLPYPTFRRYLERVADALQTSQQSLIIALDEFEKIEELIVAGKISSNFMQYLRSWIQTSSKIGFALAGLHTLEEMTSDYFQPLYASFIPPIKVSFMQLSATHVILANPSVDDFPLDYAPEALDEIYALTHGQPFLVQLLGFQLVRRYNDQVFEMQHQRNPVFTLKDVEAVVDNSVFFQQGRYYFDGVWGQAMQGASGQQAILRVLAPHQEGLGIEEITQLITDANDITIMEALMALQRHDVVEQHEGRWRIVVELFRRWILQLSNIN